MQRIEEEREEGSGGMGAFEKELERELTKNLLLMRCSRE
jgi:hypothetical protein